MSDRALPTTQQLHAAAAAAKAEHARATARRRDPHGHTHRPPPRHHRVRSSCRPGPLCGLHVVAPTAGRRRVCESLDAGWGAAAAAPHAELLQGTITY
jgi:hypothetical protein